MIFIFSSKIGFSIEIGLALPFKSAGAGVYRVFFFSSKKRSPGENFEDEPPKTASLT